MTYAEYKAEVLDAYGSEARRRQHLEDDLQESVCTFLKWALPANATFWAVPNGGRRHSREAARMVRLGVRAGVPDLHVVYLGTLYCLELKSPKGTLSDVQAQFIEKLGDCGVSTAVVRSVESVENALRVWGIPLSARLS